MSRISNLSSRIFVGGLNQAVDEADLEKAFKIFGEVTNVMVMRDRENGRSRGFSFISFKDPQSSEEAISKMHGVEIGGKCVSVRHAERAKHLDDKPRQQGSNYGRAGPAPMHSPLPYRGGGNLRPSDRVFVTQDEDQGSSNVYHSHRSRSPLDSRGGRYHDNGPYNRAYGTGEPAYAFKGNAAGEGSGYYGADRRLASDDYRGQPRLDYRSSTERELSPAREINAYINSRARSFSPLLQLSQKLISYARGPGKDDYDRSPIRSDSRPDRRHEEFSYSDRSKTNERGSQRSYQSLGTRDREDLTKHNTDYRSRSPRSTVAYQRRVSPDSTCRSGRRGDGFAKNVADGSAKRYSMERDQRRSSPVLGRGDVGIRQRRSPQRSGVRDGKWGRSHVRDERTNSPPQRSPIRGRAGRGDFETRFSQGIDSKGRNDHGQRGENTSSHRDSWNKPGIQRDRRNSPPSGGKGSSFDDRGSYGSKTMQYSQERQTDKNSALRNRDGSPRGGSWNKFQHQESNGNRIPARNSPPRRGSSISDTRGEVRAPRSAIERGREEFRAPREPYRRPQSDNRRY